MFLSRHNETCPKMDLSSRRRNADRPFPKSPTERRIRKSCFSYDVFSRYLFAYPLTDASAANTAKVIIDVMTKQSCLPTTLITDKGTAFTSMLVAEIAQILGIQIKWATTKHPQARGNSNERRQVLERILKWPQGSFDVNGINIYPCQYSTTKRPINRFFMGEYPMIFYKTIWDSTQTLKYFEQPISPKNFKEARNF